MTNKDQALIPTPAAELAEWADANVLDGTETMGALFPLVKIVQPTSGMKDASKHGGDFWHSDTESYTPAPFEFVPLMQRETRALFEEGEDKPSCASADGISPLPYQRFWDGAEKNAFGLDALWAQPAACNVCPLAEWGANGEPPFCGNSFVILVDRAMNGDTPDLAQLRLSGTSISPWKQFVRRKLRPRNLPLVSQRVMLNTIEKSAPQRKWFEIEVSSTLRGRGEAGAHMALIAREKAQFEQAAAVQDMDEVRTSTRNTSGDGWGDGTESFAKAAEPAPGDWETGD